MKYLSEVPMLDQSDPMPLVLKRWYPPVEPKPAPEPAMRFIRGIETLADSVGMHGMGAIATPRDATPRDLSLVTRLYSGTMAAGGMVTMYTTAEGHERAVHHYVPHNRVIGDFKVPADVLRAFNVHLYRVTINAETGEWCGVEPQPAATATHAVATECTPGLSDLVTVFKELNVALTHRLGPGPTGHILKDMLAAYDDARTLNEVPLASRSHLLGKLEQSLRYERAASPNRKDV